MLGRRIAARQPPPTSLPELWRALLDELGNVPQDQIDNLILSMPRRSKFSQIKELSETLKFIKYIDEASFDELHLPQFDWLEIEGFLKCNFVISSLFRYGIKNGLKQGKSGIDLKQKD
ncbi:hypothetical protein TNCV_3873131 [Trichonephila clavipes]|nr:hypothetical protein TNCV_3873131 [Trichonephila clavipes]